MSDYGCSDRDGRWLVRTAFIGVGLMLFAGFLIGRCSARYSISVDITPKHTENGANP